LARLRRFSRKIRKEKPVKIIDSKNGLWFSVARCGAKWKQGVFAPKVTMVKSVSKTVFTGVAEHAIDEKNRVTIPAKWRAAAKNARDFYIIPHPKKCLWVLTESEMQKVFDKLDQMTIGDHDKWNFVRALASRAHATPCDSQGRITITDGLLKHAGIKNAAVLVGLISKFEIWNPERWAEVDRAARDNYEEAAKQVGL
jgi:MraZ protein